MIFQFCDTQRLIIGGDGDGEDDLLGRQDAKWHWRSGKPKAQPWSPLGPGILHKCTWGLLSVTPTRLKITWLEPIITKQKKHLILKLFFPQIRHHSNILSTIFADKPKSPDNKWHARNKDIKISHWVLKDNSGVSSPPAGCHRSFRRCELLPHSRLIN